MKRPSFQFYPGDWQRDAALRACSVGARGLWIEMMCVMHQASPYGYLVLNGNPIEPGQLARMVGATEKETTRWLDELRVAGVYSVDEHGQVYSRRMVRDEQIRSARAAGGVLGGNPALVGSKVNGKVNHPINLTPTPSSSSSVSTSRKPKTSSASADMPPGFVRFWTAWPRSERKQGRAKCLEIWKRKGFEAKADQIVAHVEHMKTTDSWLAGYDPMPETYLNKQRWDGADLLAPKSGVPDYSSILTNLTDGV